MNQKTAAPASGEHRQTSFIPQLCELQTLLAVILCVQVLALVISLIRTEQGFLDWQSLGFTSLLLHAIGLMSAAAICLLQRLTKDLSVARQASIALIALIAVCAVISSFSAGTIGLTDEEFVFFIVRNTFIAALLGGLFLRYAYLRYLANMREQAELHSRIEALQSRIRPHFLFNSMNSIASLISSKPELAEDAVLDLSELFRATLNTQQSYVTIREELALCKKYLNIEGLRLGDRLRLEWDIKDEVLEHTIPPLTLQPLVENAIYHGIQPLAEGGTIRIEAYLKKNAIYLLVSNPVSREKSSRHGNQIAMGNIADRLAALYSNQAVIKTSQLNDIFTTTLRIPVLSF